MTHPTRRSVLFSALAAAAGAVAARCGLARAKPAAEPMTVRIRLDPNVRTAVEPDYMCRWELDTLDWPRWVEVRGTLQLTCEGVKKGRSAAEFRSVLADVLPPGYRWMKQHFEHPGGDVRVLSFAGVYVRSVEPVGVSMHYVVADGRVIEVGQPVWMDANGNIVPLSSVITPV